MVGTDTTPEGYVGITWFQENMDEFIFILLLGITIGFFLCYTILSIKNTIKNNQKKDTNNSKHKDESK